MSQPRKFHLFNCDNVYELSVVEDLLKAVKAKLGFEFSVEKHNFTLSEMAELSTKIIPKMQMDLQCLSSMRTNLFSSSTMTTWNMATPRFTELCCKQQVIIT